MKLELELNGQTMVALDAAALDLADYKCVVDLRKAQERAEELAPKCKEKGVAYVHVPVTAETWSEQDMDFLRRETARRWGKLAVLSAGGQRAAAVLLMHWGRSGEKTDEDTLGQCAELDDAWKERIKAYLARHRERKSAH